MGHGVLGHLMSPTRGVRKPCRRAAPAVGLARDCPRCAGGLRDCRGRHSLEYLRLRLRYERLRAAVRHTLGHLRLRLRYECLRAAVRHSCPFPLRGMAGLLQVCGGPLPKTHEKTRKKANPWRATHVIAAYLSCPSIAAFFRPWPAPNRLILVVWHSAPRRLCIMANLL